MKPQLARIAEDFESDRPVEPVTTREFLSWFDAQRRGYWVVRSIRKELEEAGIQTVPDFEAAYINAFIELRRVLPSTRPLQGESEATITEIEKDSVTPIVDVPTPITALVSKDPTYRISKLDAANKAVVSVKPDASLAESITLLLSRGFSQLPVMTSEREVKGVVSWKSIGSRLALSKPTAHAPAVPSREFMETPHREIRASASVFEAIPLIVAYEYLLVRGDDNRITGIITATDLSEQFRILAEPFLLLSEIENIVRTMIGDRGFTSSELSSVRDPGDDGRNIEGVADLTFGEYIRLLQNPDHWQRFNLAIDRVTFCKDLDSVRLIRNNVMHFDPEGIVDLDLNKLRDFTSFLKQLQNILATV
jgi:predicted transcriptional regulator